MWLVWTTHLTFSIVSWQTNNPNNYTATQRAISTCCLSHCGSTPVSYRPQHKINIVTHSWYYPNYFIWIWCLAKIEVNFPSKSKEKKKTFWIKKILCKIIFKQLLYLPMETTVYVHSEVYDNELYGTTDDYDWIISFETILDLCNFKEKSSKFAKTLARKANLIVHLKYKKDLPLKESHRGTS